MDSDFPQIPEEELEYTYFRSSGPGGQKKNTTDSAVRLRHLPTNMVVIAQRERSQRQNKLAALEELKRRLAARRRRRKPRVPTKPTRQANANRVKEKQQRGQIKKLRTRVRDVED